MLESQFAIQRELILPDQLDFGLKFEEAALHIAKIGFDCKSPMQRQIYQAFQVKTLDQLSSMTNGKYILLLWCCHMLKITN